VRIDCARSLRFTQEDNRTLRILSEAHAGIDAIYLIVWGEAVTSKRKRLKNGAHF